MLEGVCGGGITTPPAFEVVVGVGGNGKPGQYGTVREGNKLPRPRGLPF